MTRIHLDAGGHSSPAKGMCVMEVVSMLAKQPWTDSPTCTNEVITRAAQVVNDRLPDAERQKLVALIPRILRARRTESDRRVNVRLAIWCARSVLDKVRDEDRAVCEAAIAAAEGWLEGTVSDAAAYAAAYAASSASSASSAAYAAASAAYAASAAAYAAASAASAASSATYATYAAYAADAAAYGADLVGWLDALLDAWEKAVNEEGEAMWVPTEWEDEALAFLDEMHGVTS